jgi:hypothetical protein
MAEHPALLNRDLADLEQVEDLIQRLLLSRSTTDSPWQGVASTPKKLDFSKLGSASDSRKKKLLPLKR